MLRPLMLVSAIALAAPVLAQSTTTGTTTGTSTQTSTSETATAPNDDIGAVGGNTVNTQNTTQTPTQMPVQGEEEDAVDHSSMGHASSTTDTSATTGMASGTSATTGTNTGTMSGTGSMQGTTGTTGQTTAANWNNSSGMAVQPGNANPEHDARGIAVLSDPAFVPAGWNGSASSAMGGPLVDAGAGSGGGDSYPACSATVTDNCVQTYERGRR